MKRSLLPSGLVPLLLTLLVLAMWPGRAAAASWPLRVQQDPLAQQDAETNLPQAATTPVARTATHVVVKGDTLYAISRRYGISVAELMRLNRLNNAIIYVGQVLRVTSSATGGQTPYTVVAGDTLYSLAQRYGTTVDALMAANGLSGTLIYVGQLLRIPNATTPAPVPDAGSATYTVVRGDTLYAIATRYAISVDALMAANGLSSTQIYVGQLLRIPKVAATPRVVKATPTLRVTATVKATPTPRVTATVKATSSNSKVVIDDIVFKGQIAQAERDEYAVITNQGTATQNLGGWRLHADDARQNFPFPNFDLAPGQSCRIYTNEIHAETCGFSFGRGLPVWNNEGDCGRLFDANDNLVDEFCYEP